MKRFFTFGCSFTKYEWPTWADLLGKEFDEYQNWGLSGSGNQLIFNSLVECDLKNTLTKDDTVAIMWTNVTREDRYVKSSWLRYGNIFTAQFSSSVESNFFKEYSDVRGYYIRDLALIYAAKKLLDSIGCRHWFFSMVPITNVDQYRVTDATDQIDDLLVYYKPTLEKIYPSVLELVFNMDWNSRTFSNPNSPNNKTVRGDLHPTPLEHLEYIDATIGSQWISEQTRTWATLIDQKVRSYERYQDVSFTPDRW